ncbi:Outer membrane protein assembly factor BamB [Candidatus Erwinia haradaeae]|uniref:Outer membrane protein assembly factor BamB n=1 Tax=Candidatus Erwinia haradaeae TaxID=1922217 RepID=A0A451DC57_9GAMM|nr:outer membrane protein assembly factor BamB [Candidatus Erwinia haradaeae]VFP83998.1 Outer membrane protein assembly factor BamB [Candidatus Erwinia haradaeae]
MVFHKILLTNLTLLTLLSGCSWISNTDHFNKKSMLSTIQNQLAPVKIWSKTVGDGEPHSDSTLQPVASNNTVYAADPSGIVTALNVIDGKEKWKINLAERAGLFSNKMPALLSGGLTIHDHALYLGTENAKVFALNIRDGSIIWQTNVMGEVLSCPVVSDNIVLVHTSNGMLQGLNQFNGVVTWSLNLDVSEFNLRGQSSPAISYGTAVIGGDNGNVSAVMSNQGKLIWQQSITKKRSTTTGVNRLSDIDTTPLVMNGIVYAIAYNGDLTALDLQSGRILWQRDIGSVHGMVLDIDRIFLVDKEDRLMAINIKNGTNIWRQSYLLHRHLTPPALYSNHVVVGDQKGYIYWINPDSGRVVFQKQIDPTGFATQPIITNNNFLLMIQSKSNQIHAIMNE